MSLATLASDSKSLTLGQLALLVGVESVLFTRIEQGRQPMPLPLAVRIAATLEVGTGDVLSAIRPGSFIDSADPIYLTPKPGRQVLGDNLEAFNFVPTVVLS